MSEWDERRRRWRLVLGREEEQGSRGAGEQEGDGVGDESPLSAGDRALDEALGALYGDSRGGDLSKSMPDVARWLGDIRAYFPEEVADVLQHDALRRLSARQLIEHPELLAEIEPDAALAATLLSLRKVMPPQTQETARQVVARVVADLMQRLDLPLRRAAGGRVNRATRAHRPRRLSEIDWSRTLRANLKHYQPDQKTVVPEILIG